MGQILTINDIMLCPHGGTVSLASLQNRTSAGSGLVLRATDVFVVAGCALTVSVLPHPCITVEWRNYSTKCKVGGDGVLTTSSIGLCKAADQAVQGTAIIQKTQMKASAK